MRKNVGFGDQHLSCISLLDSGDLMNLNRD